MQRDIWDKHVPIRENVLDPITKLLIWFLHRFFVLVTQNPFPGTSRCPRIHKDPCIAWRTSHQQRTRSKPKNLPQDLEESKSRHGSSIVDGSLCSWQMVWMEKKLRWHVHPFSTKKIGISSEYISPLRTWRVKYVPPFASIAVKAFPGLKWCNCWKYVTVFVCRNYSKVCMHTTPIQALSEFPSTRQWTTKVFFLSASHVHPIFAWAIGGYFGWDNHANNEVHIFYWLYNMCNGSKYVFQNIAGFFCTNHCTCVPLSIWRNTFVIWPWPLKASRQSRSWIDLFLNWILVRAQWTMDPDLTRCAHASFPITFWCMISIYAGYDVHAVDPYTRVYHLIIIPKPSKGRTRFECSLGIVWARKSAMCNLRFGFFTPPQKG